jgi:iron complex transport system permease protein
VIKSRFGALALLVAILVSVSALGVLFGTEPASLSRALADPNSIDREFLFVVRPPRVALAALAGGGLALVGAVFQALLRNPLAEPYVLGVSGGAAFGATTAIALGLGASTILGAALVPAAAFAGGVLATFLVYVIVRDEAGGSSGTTILLAGVMVNSIAAALITFMKSLVTPSRAQELLRWLTGFVDLPTAPALGFLALYTLVGGAFLIRDAARFNLLALGDDPAFALGLDVTALERRAFLACSFIVGAIVSVTGLIGFVGLVVPHALRRILGPDHRLLLPASLLGGATMLVASDLAARLSFRVMQQGELPVGAVTALVGGPVFLAMLRRSKGRQFG